jgi:RNA polymerase sigma-70 factor (ECF subfamily)
MAIGFATAILTPNGKTGDALEPTDIELVRQARKGRHDAFHQLMDRYAPPLLRLAGTLVPARADAEDVVQETFTAAFRGLKSFQERSSVKTWLYAILFRQAALFRRKHRMPLRFLADEGSLPAPTTDDVAPHIAAIDARLDLDAALALLPEDHRAILILREIEGLPYDDIAQMLNVPRGTVESRLFRARQALKQWFSSRAQDRPT